MDRSIDVDLKGKELVPITAAMSTQEEQQVTSTMEDFAKENEENKISSNKDQEDSEPRESQSLGSSPRRNSSDSDNYEYGYGDDPCDQEDENEDEDPGYEDDEDVTPAPRREVRSDSEEEEESEDSDSEENRMYEERVKAHHAKKKAADNDEVQESASTEDSKAPKNETEEDNDQNAVRIQEHQARGTSEDPPESEPLTEADKDHQRWLDTILHQQCESEEDSDDEEKEEYQRMMDRAMEKEMEKLRMSLGASEGQDEEQNRKLEDEMIKEVENLKVTTTLGASGSLKAKNDSEPQESPESSRRVSRESEDSRAPALRRSPNPWPAPRQGPTYAQWNAQQNSAYYNSSYPRDQNQGFERQETSDSDSCADDADFEDYMLPSQSNRGPTEAEREQRRNRPVVQNPFGGAPVSRIIRGESGKQWKGEGGRQENAIHCKTRPVHQRREQNDHQNFGNGWDFGSFPSSSNRNSNNDLPKDSRSNTSSDSSRSNQNRGAQKNYGYHPGPPTNVSHRDNRNSSRLSEFNNYGYHPGPPTFPKRQDGERRSNQRESNSRPQEPPRSPRNNVENQRNQGQTSSNFDNRQCQQPHQNPRQNVGNQRNHEQSSSNQNNRQSQEPCQNPKTSVGNHQNQGQTSLHQSSSKGQTSHNQPPHPSQPNQPSCSETVKKEETEKEKIIRQEEEERLSLEYIKKTTSLAQRAEIENLCKYYDDKKKAQQTRPPFSNHHKENSQNQQWVPPPGQQGSWESRSGSTRGSVNYQQNQASQNSMAPFGYPQGNYQIPQIPGFPQQQQNWNMNPNFNGPMVPGPSQNYQNFPQQPMGQMQPYQPAPPQSPMMMMNQIQNPLLQAHPAGFPGFPVGSPLPILNFTHQSPPTVIMQQILGFLEGYKMAGIPVFISTLEQPPNQIPQYFAFDEFIKKHLASVVQLQMEQNHGRTEYMISLL